MKEKENEGLLPGFARDCEYARKNSFKQVILDKSLDRYTVYFDWCILFYYFKNGSSMFSMSQFHKAPRASFVQHGEC